MRKQGFALSFVAVATCLASAMLATPQALAQTNRVRAPAPVLLPPAEHRYPVPTYSAVWLEAGIGLAATRNNTTGIFGGTPDAVGSGVTLTDNSVAWTPSFRLGAYGRPWSAPVFLGLVTNVTLPGRSSIQTGITSTDIPVTVNFNPGATLEIMGRFGAPVVPGVKAFGEGGMQTRWGDYSVVAPTVGDVFPGDIHVSRAVLGGGIQFSPALLVNGDKFYRDCLWALECLYIEFEVTRSIGATRTAFGGRNGPSFGEATTGNVTTARASFIYDIPIRNAVIAHQRIFTP